MGSNRKSPKGTGPPETQGGGTLFDDDRLLEMYATVKALGEGVKATQTAASATADIVRVEVGQMRADLKEHVQVSNEQHTQTQRELGELHGELRGLAGRVAALENRPPQSPPSKPRFTVKGAWEAFQSANGFIKALATLAALFTTGGIAAVWAYFAKGGASTP